MGKYRLLFKTAARKQSGGIPGILLPTFVLALCLFSVLTVYFSGVSPVEREMNRLGFGDFTLWVSGQTSPL